VDLLNSAKDKNQQWLLNSRSTTVPPFQITCYCILF